MYKKVFYLLVVLACTAALNSCDDPEDSHPIVGTWEADVPSGDDFSYDATWRFNNDGSYDLDFSSGYIGGGVQGHSYGAYDLISDSILVVHSADHENLWINYAFTNEKDTLFVEVADSRLTSSGVRLVGPLQYKIAGDTIGWEKLIE